MQKKKYKWILIKEGRRTRKVRVVNLKNYIKVGKKGKLNLYKKKTKKQLEKRGKGKKRTAGKTKRGTRYTEQVKRNKVVKISKEEEGFIRKIKGGNFRNENEIAKKLLKEVRLLPRFEKEEYVRKINPDRKIMSTGKTYGSYSDLESNKRDIYMELMKNLITAKNDKFHNKLYALRKELLKDGIVIEVDVYGVFAKNSKKKVYMGTLGFVGLMIEEAGFIESQLTGWSGENRTLVLEFDRIAKGHGGQKCYWIKNNMALDTETIYITDVMCRLNYA